jgi:acetolactate synthase regulatory subunit
LSFKLLVRLRRAERSLERALGVAGRRGYEVVSVSASRVQDGTELVAHLELEGGASPETLIHHLQKLDEVQSAAREDASSDSTGDTR